jgi:F-type H+-transporting ATPase subunit alpha
MPVEEQVVVLYSATNKYLMDLPVKEVRRFNSELLRFVKDKYPNIMQYIKETGEISSETEEIIKKALDELKASYQY